LPQGHFIQGLYVLKASYAFNPDLKIASLAQHDSTVGHIGVKARLQPGATQPRREASITDPYTCALRWRTS